MTCTVSEEVRPTPQMVREALFSILGDAVPERLFVDVFAGTGAVGLEALSRGASAALFLERDPRLLADLERHLHDFKVARLARLVRTDVYRWASRWQAPAEPVNLFLSPPFRDLEERRPELAGLVAILQQKVAPGSVLVLQVEKNFPTAELPGAGWEERHYGRNVLLLWLKVQPPASEPPAADFDG
jgi:16S rRNA (guanine(966)-N(2))-methyltransferase RsmD